MTDKINLDEWKAHITGKKFGWGYDTIPFQELFHQVIPVCYGQGSGGSFLCAYLTMAKYNQKAADFNCSFSKHGNAHEISYEVQDNCVANKEIWDNDVPLTKFYYLFTNFFVVSKNSKPVYFFRNHCFHLSVILYISTKFDKSIYIIPDDTRVRAMYDKKCMLEVLNIEQTSDNSPILSEVKFENFIKCKPAKIRTLLINLSELLDVNSKEVVTKKLSDYTEIPFDQFDLEFFKEWQDVTHLSLKE